MLGGIYATCLTHDIEEGLCRWPLKRRWFLFLEGLKGANVSLHQGIHPEAEEMPLDYSPLSEVQAGLQPAGVAGTSAVFALSLL